MNAKVTQCGAAFLVGIVCACSWWEWCDPRYKKSEMEKEYERGVVDGKKTAEKEVREKVIEDIKKLEETNQLTLVWKVKRNLDGVLEIQDWKVKTILRERTAVSGGNIERSIPPGRYDYFSFVRCPKSNCALAIAVDLNDGQCFLVHFTGNIPNQKRGIVINRDTSISFY